MTDFDAAQIKAARRDGTLKLLLRQQIAEGKARLGDAPAKNWPASGRRRDINGITCPHCHAGPDQRCHVLSRDKTLPQPHQQRLAVWAQTVACCTTCEVEPGQRCHNDGIPLPPNTVHPARYVGAEGNAA